MARGLPTNFALNIPPQDGPVHLGDFLDEPPPAPMPAKRPLPVERKAAEQSEERLTPSLVPDRKAGEMSPVSTRVVRQKLIPPKPPRVQVNLTKNAENMLAEVMTHLDNFSPYDVANSSEVFQGLLGLLHGALEELDLSELPRRGAWGSVTARNFPSALGEAFERALLQAAGKRVGR